MNEGGVTNRLVVKDKEEAMEMAAKHYILAGSLLDGSGAKVRKNVCLVLENGRISSLDSPGILHDGKDARITDLSYCTLLPPLVDCMVHLSFSAATDERQRLVYAHAGESEISRLIRQNMHYCHSHGVLGIGDVDGCCLTFVHDTMGKEHVGEEYLFFKEPLVTMLVAADGKSHHDYGNFFSFQDKDPGTGLCGYELKRDVVEAEKQGKKIFTWAHGREAVAEALDAGCHAIVQGLRMGEENLVRMAQQGVVWLPMIFHMQTMLLNERRAGSGDRAAYAGMQMDQLALAKKHGVRVAVATGSGGKGILHGESLVEEMKWLRRAGYSIEETIRCATINGSELLGIKEISVLEAGAQANFLVSRGMAAQLPRKLSYLEGIYRNGQPSQAYRKNPVKTVYPKK